MNHDNYDPSLIRDVLKKTRRIAMVGASPNPARPSNGVLRFLLSKGYDVVPINPGHAGKQIHGQTVAASLAAVEGPIDMVDVFRAADQLPALVEEVLALPNRPKVICDLGPAHRAPRRGGAQGGGSRRHGHHGPVSGN
jgi:predicted CoA-binding protein